MECNQKSVTEGNFKNKKYYKYYEKLHNIKFDNLNEKDIVPEKNINY